MSLFQTAAHVAHRVRHAFRSPQPRDPHWASVRKAFLSAHLECAACGSSKSLEAHHVMPFHIDPQRELDPTNLIALCLSPGRWCHLAIGHGGNYRAYNPAARDDADAMRAALDSGDKDAASAILARAKAYRVNPAA